MNSFVETDPSCRYQRFSEKLGEGSFKVVYKAFDSELGKEVAWNQVKISGGSKETKEEKLQKVLEEVKTLQSLRHKHIIECFDSWVDHDKEQVNFITEMMTCSLKSFVEKKKVNVKACRNWSRQILQALHFLHHHQGKPIIHRDIKCDNIFINSHNGEVKLGDLGLSTTMVETHAQSVIGTPEFMAPELFDEKYTEKVDIYAFGMCLLEIFTNEYPYSECCNAAQVYKKVMRGEPPRSLEKMENVAVKHFIEECLRKEDERPSAEELLEHPLMQDLDADSFVSQSLGPSQGCGLDDVPRLVRSLVPDERGVMGQSCSSHHRAPAAESLTQHALQAAVPSASAGVAALAAVTAPAVSTTSPLAGLGDGSAQTFPPLSSADSGALVAGGSRQLSVVGGMTYSSVVTGGAHTQHASAPVQGGLSEVTGRIESGLSVGAGGVGQVAAMQEWGTDVRAEVQAKALQGGEGFHRDAISIMINARIQGKAKIIQFDFHINQDTAEQCASDLLSQCPNIADHQSLVKIIQDRVDEWKNAPPAGVVLSAPIIAGPGDVSHIDPGFASGLDPTARIAELNEADQNARRGSLPGAAIAATAAAEVTLQPSNQVRQAASNQPPGAVSRPPPMVPGVVLSPFANNVSGVPPPAPHPASAPLTYRELEQTTCVPSLSEAGDVGFHVASAVPHAPAAATPSTTYTSVGARNHLGSIHQAVVHDSQQPFSPAATANEFIERTDAPRVLLAGGTGGPRAVECIRSSSAGEEVVVRLGDGEALGDSNPRAASHGSSTLSKLNVAVDSQDTGVSRRRPAAIDAGDGNRDRHGGIEAQRRGSNPPADLSVGAATGSHVMDPARMDQPVAASPRGHLLSNHVLPVATPAHHHTLPITPSPAALSVQVPPPMARQGPLPLSMQAKQGPLVQPPLQHQHQHQSLPVGQLVHVMPASQALQVPAQQDPHRNPPTSAKYSVASSQGMPLHPAQLPSAVNTNPQQHLPPHQLQSVQAPQQTMMQTGLQQFQQPIQAPPLNHIEPPHVQPQQQVAQHLPLQQPAFRLQATEVGQHITTGQSLQPPSQRPSAQTQLPRSSSLPSTPTDGREHAEDGAVAALTFDEAADVGGENSSTLTGVEDRIGTKEGLDKKYWEKLVELQQHYIQEVLALADPSQKQDAFTSASRFIAENTRPAVFEIDPDSHPAAVRPAPAAAGSLAARLEAGPGEGSTGGAAGVASPPKGAAEDRA